MNLDELKAENAKAEDDVAQSPQIEPTELEVEAVEEEAKEPVEAGEPEQEAEVEAEANTEAEESAEAEIEDWMRSDDQASQADKKFTDSDVAAARKKVRAKLERKIDERDQEIEKLKKQLEGKPEAVKPQPKREQFFDAEDPEQAYLDAYTDWRYDQKASEQAAATAAANQKLAQQQQQKQIDEAVSQHYERAASLAEKSGISAEAYQSADYRVKAAIDSILPGAGDSVAETLISQLGDGSEKVMYSLGVNQARLNELTDKLRNDPSGISAAMYLGQLKAQAKAPAKRKTNAPKPAPQVKGDASGVGHEALERKYKKAHSSKNLQEAFNLKRQARAAGVNTSNW